MKTQKLHRAFLINTRWNIVIKMMENNNRIKALFFDIDGTLVPYGTGHIPERIVNVSYMEVSRKKKHLGKLTPSLTTIHFTLNYTNGLWKYWMKFTIKR